MILSAEDFNVTDTSLAVNEFDAKKAGKELDLTDLDPGKIEMELKWCPFKEKFLNMDKNVMVVDKPPYIM